MSGIGYFVSSLDDAEAMRGVCNIVYGNLLRYYD